jgi:predicted nucleotidyltransferase
LVNYLFRSSRLVGSGEFAKKKESVVQPTNIKYDDAKLREICLRWKIKEISLFGSVLRDDFNSDSDIDILIEFLPEARITLFKHQLLKEEFEDFFSKKVDLVSKSALLCSTNRFRKEGILSNTSLIYGS